MAVKIIMDAGHGGYDNGASYNGRNEKDDVLALTLAVGEILQAQGYDVEYTRTEDVYDSPVQKARIGNASGADFFVSIHRNSSPTANQYEGVQTLVFDDSGVKAAMARNVNDELEKVGYRNINVSVRPNLAVLRRTQMPAILIEAGFINSDKDNKLFDTKFSQTAEAIAVGIDKTIREAGLAATSSRTAEEDRKDDEGNDMYEEDTYVNNMYEKNTVENAPADGRMQYQILTGIFRSFGSASYQMNRFINEGYMAELYEDDGLYQVRVGLYPDIEEALIAQRELRDKGYETLIVRAETE